MDIINSSFIADTQKSYVLSLKSWAGAEQGLNLESRNAHLESRNALTTVLHWGRMPLMGMCWS